MAALGEVRDRFRRRAYAGGSDASTWGLLAAEAAAPGYLLRMLIFLLSMASATEPGDVIDRAAALHVSRAGLANLGAAIARVLPTELDVTGVDTEFACDPGDPDPLQFVLPSLHADLFTDAVQITPGDGVLHVHIDLGLALTATDVGVTGSCTFLLQDVDYTCRVETGLVEPIDLVLDLDVALELSPDGVILANVGALDYGLGPIDNPLAGCRRLRELFDSISVLSLDSADTDTTNPLFFTTLIDGFIAPALETVPADLSVAVQDALAVLPIVQSLDVLGTSLDLSLAPSALWIDEGGLFIGLAATADAPWDDVCVPGVDLGTDALPVPPAGPPLSGADWPALGDNAYGGADLPYDAAIFLSRDLVDQVGFVAWQAGMLCLDVGELSPIPLGTSLLGNLFGLPFVELFPQNQPADLRIDASEPPTGRFSEDALVELELGGLGLDVYSLLDGRDARVCRTGIDAELGLSAELTDAGLALGLDIDPTTWSFSEERPDVLGPGFSQGVATGLPTILSAVLPADLLPTVPLPAWQGVGVGGLTVRPSADGAWQGLFLTVSADAAEPIVLEGCAAGCDGGAGPSLDLGAALGCDDPAGCGGCSGDSSTCDSGCDSGGAAGRTLAWIVGMVAVAARRRR